MRLRTKVSLFFGIIALIATVSLTVVTYAFARSSLLDQRDELARTQAVSNALRVRDLLRSGTSPGDWFPNLRVESGGFAAAILGNDAPYATDNRFSFETFPPELRRAVEAGSAGAQRFDLGDERYVGVGVKIAEADADYFEAFRLGPTEDTLRTILFTLVVGSVVTILLATFAGWWTSGRLLRPLGRITDAAGEIAAGDLDTRVVREGDPDLDRLADSFNDMADAVQARIEREARFASDVSHELRSPITALAAAAEVINGRRGELPDRTQQALDVVVGQVRRFDSMVIDLLELSRIDAGATDLHTEQVEIETLCRRVAARNGFADLPIEVTKGPGMNGAAMTATVDRLRFERILANLLENALHHGGGPVRVSIEPTDGPFLLVAVEDAGPGVARGERARIFERFATAQGGEAWVEDRPSGGARFVVRLPLGTDR
jgi:two-component system sensor histidine kinase MtrB